MKEKDYIYLPRSPGYRAALERFYESGSKRRLFRATFDHLGHTRGLERRVLLVQVCDAETGEEVADHVWMDDVVFLERIGAAERGELIAFRATIVPYVKGRKNEEGLSVDFRLIKPTKARK